MKHRIILMAAAVCAMALGVSLADTVGYWRMEGTDGASADKTTMPSEVNASAVSGIGCKAAGGKLAYSSEVAGAFILDPETGKTTPNKTSMRFATVGEGDKTVADYIAVEAGEPLDVKSFTLEGFIRYEGEGGQKWTPIISRQSKAEEYLCPFALDTEWWDPEHSLRLRAKLRVEGADFIQHRNEDSPVVTEEGWHHFACTYDAAAGEAKVYWDYKLATSFKVADPAKHPLIAPKDAVLYIGGAPQGKGWNGWLDEVRLSNKALEPQKFLRAVKQPATPTTAPTTTTRPATGSAPAAAK
jgi:hypothetical protein